MSGSGSFWRPSRRTFVAGAAAGLAASALPRPALSLANRRPTQPYGV